MPLETPRLRLRPLRWRDAAWLRGAAHLVLKRGVWAMEERGSCEPAGWIRAEPPLACVVRPRYRRRGYATEALDAVMRHAFLDEHQPGLWSRPLGEDPAAHRLAEQAGFTCEHNQCWIAAGQWWRTQLRPASRTALERLDAGLPAMHTDRLWLRPAVEADVEPLAEMRTDEAVMELMLDRPVNRVDARALERREIERERRRLVIADVRTGEPLGWVALGELVSVENPTVGYALRRSAWGRGIAAEATRRVVSYALTEAASPAVEAVVFRENTRSCRVLEKSGFALVRHGSFAGRDSAFYQVAA